MSSTNDITGDLLKSKPANDTYRDNYDRIFGEKKKVTLTKEQQAAVDDTAGVEKENDNER